MAPFSVSAAVSLDEEAGFTIEVVDHDTKEPVGDAVFRLYFVADAVAYGEGVTFTYTEDFQKNGMKLTGSDDKVLAPHLAAYAYTKDIPYTIVSSDDDDRIFVENLRCGVYLLVPISIAEGYLNPNPVILRMPVYDNGIWWYHVISRPKSQVDRGPEKKTYFRVEKKWENTDQIPESIAVTLSKDGVPEKTVLLNAENGWQYRWDNLDDNHAWSITEIECPDGFTVSYDFSENVVYIINTYEGETTTTTTTTTGTTATTPSGSTTSAPSGVTTTTGEGTTTTDESTTTTGLSTTTTGEDTTTTDEGTTTTDEGMTTTTGKGTTTTKPEELIQSGQLNWPIPIMLMAGLTLLSIGWAMLNFSRRDEDDV